MKQKSYIAYASVILAMIFWSFTFVWYKVVYQYYNPITTVLFRLVISSVFLLLLTYPLKRLQKLKVKDFKYFALVTFYQPFLYFIGESYGVQLVSSTLSSVIIATIPLFTVIVSFFFYKEKISKTNILGIIFSVIGVSLVIFNKSENLTASTLGISMLLLAVFASIGYSIVIKKLSNKYNSITIVTYHNILGVFYFIPLFFIFDYKDFLLSGFSDDAWVPLLELAIFGSSFAFIFFTFSIKKLGVTKANAFTNMIPVFTAIFAFYVLDETLNTSKITGISFVIAGLFLSQIKTLSLKDKLKIFIKPNE